MQIILAQISNGWTTTIVLPGQGNSTLFTSSLEEALDEVRDLSKAAKEQQEKGKSSIVKGIHIPNNPPLSGP